MADLLILFGSQTGNAESVAQDVYLAAQAYSVDAQCLGMEKITAQDLAQTRDVLLIVSTCGDGDMPDNALPLWQALHTAETPAMQGVHYAVLALGDLLYDHFCAAGKAWDARLDTLGANRLRARVDCDVEFQADATAWTQATLAQLAGLRGWATRNIQPPPRPHTEPGYARDTPLTATLLTRQKLTADHAVREVWHCELELGSDVAWQPGALLYIWPENDAQLVAKIIAALSARPADQVHWQGRRERLDTLLTHHLELRKPGAELLAALAHDAHDGQDVLDCLLARPVLDAQDAVECLKALAPRAYSIANAQQNGNRVHLTVAHVQYERNGRHYHGAASHFLATLPHGGTLRCHLAANRYFTVPDNPASDLIMIAAGSGIAPFRAFMQQRDKQNARGRNWLIFGNRKGSQDFLYGHEWQARQADGTLDRLSLAFSREQAHKTYVQDLVREHGAELFAWLEQGAYLMVCGSADPMAAEVETALREVIMKHGNMRAADADGYIARLKNDKRHVRDVY